MAYLRGFLSSTDGLVGHASHMSTTAGNNLRLRQNAFAPAGLVIERKLSYWCSVAAPVMRCVMHGVLTAGNPLAFWGQIYRCYAGRYC